jgi:uncharacterized coiled-coil protein SlyX
MQRTSKADELRQRLSIEMDHIKARMLEIKAQARKLGLEARLDLEKRLGPFEKAQEELKAHIAEWAKAGEKATADIRKRLEKGAKDLKKAVDDVAARLK